MVSETMGIKKIVAQDNKNNSRYLKEVHNDTGQKQPLLKVPCRNMRRENGLANHSTYDCVTDDPLFTLYISILAYPYISQSLLRRMYAQFAAYFVSSPS